MELVEGGTLDSKREILSLTKKLLIIADISDALNYVHERGVILRDLKPANILLSNEMKNGTYPSHPLAKLADFGLNLDANASRISQSGDGLTGTASYMAPEDIKTKSSDIYSLGVILYELTTGKLPFEGHPFAVINDHKTKPPVSPKKRIEQLNKASRNGTILEIPPQLEALITVLMEKDPERRIFRDARKIAIELRSIVSPSKLKGVLPKLK